MNTYCFSFTNVPGSLLVSAPDPNKAMNKALQIEIQWRETQFVGANHFIAQINFESIKVV